MTTAKTSTAPDGRRRVVGVGSVAVAILAKLGYEVHAATGSSDAADYLQQLGASEIVARDELAEPNGKPLNRERWAGAIDNVGGSTLANVLTQIKYCGSVAAIGLAGGNKLDATVIPFLLRGVNLLGIDSVMCPLPRRQQAWQRLASDLPMAHLDAMTRVASLDETIALGSDILKGQVQGRVVVDLNG